MSYGSLLFAGICWFCALIFGVMALWAFKRRTPMHFWSGSTVHPDEITDIPAYNRANGMMWAVYAACMALAGIVALFSIAAGTVLLLTACLPGIVVLIIVYKRIYHKYKRESYISEKHRIPSKTAKVLIIGTVIVSCLIFIAVGLLFYYGEKDPEIVIVDNRIQNSSLYGRNIHLTDISGVSLLQESMNDIGGVGTRTNGFSGFGQARKGWFQSDELGSMLLFVQADTAPTIRLERRNQAYTIYISFRDSAETERLYRELRNAMR